MLFSVSLFLACVCLFAQNLREARIYVPPISGNGEVGDNAFFFKQLTYEVVVQYHLLVRTQSASDFVLRSSIQRYTGEEQLRGSYLFRTEERGGAAYSGPVPPRPIPRIRNTLGRREFFSWEADGNITFFDTTGDEEYSSGPSIVPALVERRDRERENILPEYDEYVFFLELIDSSTGEALAKQHLVYRSVDDSVGTLVSVIVYNMLVGIPDIEENDDWRNNWLFADISAMWAPMVYPSQQQPVNWVNFGLGLSAEYQFLDFLAVGFGFQLVQNLVVSASDSTEYRDFILQAPLSIKYVLKPLEHFMLEPYLGLSYNLSLTGVTQASPLSWFAGFQVGAKAGLGMVVIDPRFSMDFSDSIIPESSIPPYKRYLIQLSVGYKFGFLPKYSKKPRVN